MSSLGWFVTMCIINLLVGFWAGWMLRGVDARLNG